MCKITVTQVGTVLKVKVNPRLIQPCRLRGRDFNVEIVSDPVPSYMFNDGATLCLSSHDEVCFGSTSYHTCSELVRKLVGTLTENNIEVEFKNATPIWLEAFSSDVGVSLRVEHLDPNYAGRYENNYFCFSDKTDRRRKKITLCPEKLKVGQVLSYSRSECSPFDVRMSLRSLMISISEVEKVLEPSGNVCEVAGNRFRYRGSNRLLSRGKVLAYRYPALGGWSDKYTTRLPISHVKVE